MSALKHLFLTVSLGLATAFPRAARAEGPVPVKTTDLNAFTIGAGDFRLGFQKLEVGLFSRLTLSTHTLPWLLMPVLQGPLINLSAKGVWLNEEKIRGAFSAGAFYVDVENPPGSNLDELSFRAVVIPSSHFLSWAPVPDTVVSLETTWVQSILGSDVQSAGEASAWGTGAQNSLQIGVHLEQQLGEHVTLHLATRLAPVVQPLTVSTEVATTEGTSANIEAEVSSSQSGGAFLILPAVTAHFGKFHLRGGLGYGNYFVPGFLLILPRRTLAPDLDFYFVF